MRVVGGGNVVWSRISFAKRMESKKDWFFRLGFFTEYLVKERATCKRGLEDV